LAAIAFSSFTTFLLLLLLRRLIQVFLRLEEWLERGVLDELLQQLVLDGLVAWGRKVVAAAKDRRRWEEAAAFADLIANTADLRGHLRDWRVDRDWGGKQGRELLFLANLLADAAQLVLLRELVQLGNLLDQLLDQALLVQDLGRGEDWEGRGVANFGAGRADLRVGHVWGRRLANVLAVVAED